MIMKKNMRAYLAWLLAAILLTAALGGCMASDDGEGEELKEYPVTLYYVNPKYLETGDESIDPLVVKEAVLSVEKDDLEERYEEALDLLAEKEEGMDTMVGREMVDDVTVRDGVATVDFDGEEMSGGSMEEIYLIEQVVRTLIKSFDDVERVRFTVDEKEVDSLMGHLEANCVYGLITVNEEGSDVELVSILD